VVVGVGAKLLVSWLVLLPSSAKNGASAGRSCQLPLVSSYPASAPMSVL
jgi:hypothetical protein